jgi:hypothetical protein
MSISFLLDEKPTVVAVGSAVHQRWSVNFSSPAQGIGSSSYPSQELLAWRSGFYIAGLSWQPFSLAGQPRASCSGHVGLEQRFDAMKCACESCAMPILQNARHERFAQLVASGKHRDMEAFKQAGYADESAHQNACRLRANESVVARIEELRARNAEKCQLSRDEAVQVSGGDSENSHRRSNRRSPTGAVLRRKKRQDRTSQQAWRGCSSLPNSAAGTSPRSTRSSMGTRRSRSSSKSSHDCAGVERYATIRVLDKLAR